MIKNQAQRQMSNSIDFSDVLDIQELQLSFQRKQIQAVQDFYEQTALINYLTNN